MDWQTKEYIDSRFDSLEEQMDSITKHLNIEEEDFDDEDLEDEQLDVEEDNKPAL